LFELNSFNTFSLTSFELKEFEILSYVLASSLFVISLPFKINLLSTSITAGISISFILPLSSIVAVMIPDLVLNSVWEFVSLDEIKFNRSVFISMFVDFKFEAIKFILFAFKSILFALNRFDELWEIIVSFSLDELLLRPPKLDLLVWVS